MAADCASAVSASGLVATGAGGASAVDDSRRVTADRAALNSPPTLNEKLGEGVHVLRPEARLPRLHDPSGEQAALQDLVLRRKVAVVVERRAPRARR